jgi:hypothetical protein
MPVREDIKDAFIAVSTEALFAVLPLFVVAIVLRHKGVWYLLGSSEWSFGACILAGQTLVRFGAGMARANRGTERVAFAIALLFVFTVAPCLVVLSEVVRSAHHVGHTLAIIQVSLFAVSLIMFFVFGMLGHLARERS